MSSDLVPESDLSSVPARNPCGEQLLHVAQEYHTVYPVILTTGLLVYIKTEQSSMFVAVVVAMMRL